MGVLGSNGRFCRWRGRGGWARGLRTAGLLAAGLLLAPASQAQPAWPQRPIHLVVPYAPGGNTDTMARMLARHLNKVLGQPVIVDNHVGAGGIVASEFVAHGPHDGYTLFFASNSQIEIQPHVQKVNYDAEKDFVPVFPFGVNAFVLGVSSRLPVRTLAEFIAYGRAHPGQINYASGGVGSVGHLAGAMFAQRAGIDMSFVPYKGSSQSATALAAGEVEMYFGNFADVVPQAAGDRVRMLAVSSAARDPRLPQIPALSELYPGFSVRTWNGLLAPAGTPAGIIERLARECQPAVGDPDTAHRLAEMGVDPFCMAPQAFGELIRRESAQYGAAARAAGLKAE
jgi:tripartite-type tricarboxylate transporter receptor subunit TctC